MNGYIGKILEVDLSTGRLADRSIDEKTARKFLGGKGLGGGHAVVPDCA
ncbi:MAG: hypothetical protein C5S49_06640 [Candidatus Methanogaster sp.]|nr:MAG: hypothetical protein C5S49_06640 [ANME-2 cluster archaeon]